MIVSAIPSVKFVPPLPEPLPNVIVSAPGLAFASKIASRSVVKLSAVVLSAAEVTTNAARSTRCSSSVSDARDSIDFLRRELRESREGVRDWAPENWETRRVMKFLKVIIEYPDWFRKLNPPYPIRQTKPHLPLHQEQ